MNKKRSHGYADSLCSSAPWKRYAEPFLSKGYSRRVVTMKWEIHELGFLIAHLQTRLQFSEHLPKLFPKKTDCFYSQLHQNYLNNYLQATVGREFPKQFPEPLSVGKLNVSNFALSNMANTLQARNYLKYFQRGSKLVIYYLINCWYNNCPVCNLGGADCMTRQTHRHHCPRCCDKSATEKKSKKVTDVLRAKETRQKANKAKLQMTRAILDFNIALDRRETILATLKHIFERCADLHRGRNWAAIPLTQTIKNTKTILMTNTTHDATNIPLSIEYLNTWNLSMF